MDITIGENIASLRKTKNVTQEQMAIELNISAQAISKWETNTCMPDTLTLPLVAKYFDVSIDYLYYGKDVSYSDILEKVNYKIASMGQFKGFDEALKIFAYAHHGLSCNNLRGKDTLYDLASNAIPAHISDEHGVSLLSGKGYGAIITRNFFESIGFPTVEFSSPILKALSVPEQMKIVMAIISMSDISFTELKELLHFDDDVLRKGLDNLIESKIITETVSKHKTLGTTYNIYNNIGDANVPNYHSGICIILATLEMIRYGTEGINCCAGYGDYPIKFD